MSASIRCCYRGCVITAWDTVDGHLSIVADSATCQACRRVSLCAAHLGQLFDSPFGLACSHCGATDWTVTLFGTTTLDGRLEAAIEAGGGRIKRLPGAEPAAEPTLDVPADWSLFDSEAGAPRPGLKVVIGPEGRVELAGYPPFEPVRVFADVRDGAAAPDGQAFVLESAHSDQEPSQLRWQSRDGASVQLPNPHQRSNHGPCFLDAETFVYLSDLPEGRAELRFARVVSEGRIESRRVVGFGKHPALAPARLDGQHVLLFEPDGRLCRPMVLRVSDAKTCWRGPSISPPRLRAGGGGVGVWVDHADRLFAADSKGSIAVEARCPAEAISVAGDGERIGWVEAGATQVLSLASGRIIAYPTTSPADVVAWAIT